MYVCMYVRCSYVRPLYSTKITVTSVLVKHNALLKRKVFSWRQKDVSVNDWSRSDNCTFKFLHRLETSAVVNHLLNRDVLDVIFLPSGRNRNRNRIVRNMFLTNKMAPGRWSNLLPKTTKVLIAIVFNLFYISIYLSIFIYSSTTSTSTKFTDSCKERFLCTTVIRFRYPVSGNNWAETGTGTG